MAHIHILLIDDRMLENVNRKVDQIDQLLLYYAMTRYQRFARVHMNHFWEFSVTSICTH